MCLPERLAILICFDANAHVLFTGDKKLVVPFHTLPTYLPEGKKIVFLNCYCLKRTRCREGIAICFCYSETKITHVFARAGGNLKVL